MNERPRLELVFDETSERNGNDRLQFSLDAALVATRRHFDGQSERAGETEERLFQHAWPKPQRRVGLWLLPLAAVFAGSAAFAGEIGAIFETARAHWLGTSDTIAARPSRPASKPTRASVQAPAPRSSSASVDADGRTESPSRLEVPVPPAPRMQGTHHPRTAAGGLAKPIAAASASTSSTDAATPIAAPPTPLELYREARRAHFVDHDYGAALAAWDQYLAADPRGNFAPEARFNRAIALYRLGNTARARQALRPFAEGAYGHYRQDEARQLLEELR